MSDLKTAWPQLVRLLQSGVNLIPVRDKDDDKGGRKKHSYVSWKKYQSEMNTEANLFHEMELYNTTGAKYMFGY